jgi:hypothetical protein
MQIMKYIPYEKKGKNKGNSNQNEIGTKDNPTRHESVFKIS